jgi:hypothetical protein
MWRSFFFAVGVILILAGAQCLVVEKFFVDSNNPLLSVARKSSNSNAQPIQPLANNQYSVQTEQSRFSLPSSASAYGGPSRFQTQGFRPAPYDPSGNYRTPANVAGFNSNINNAPVAVSVNRTKALKSYLIEDWMPWGLLAIGTIVILYTNSTHRRSYNYSNE